MKWLIALALTGCISRPDPPAADARHWQLRPDAREPGPMSAARMAYDPDDGDVVMFAGPTNGVLSNAIYALGDAGWTQICTGTGGPSPRLVPQFTYDARLERVIVAGGTTALLLTGDGLLEDVYACDRATNTWSTLPMLPYGAAGGSILEYQGALYLIGGLTPDAGNTRVHSLVNDTMWIDEHDLPDLGVATYATSMAYDSDNDRVLAFPEVDDGTQYTNTLYAFIDGDWSTVCDSCGDVALEGATLTVVPGESAYLIDGYSSENDSGELGLTSQLAGDTFVEIATQPPPRDSVAAAYDATRDVVVLYGGNGPSCTSAMGSNTNGEDCDETWELVK